MSILTIVKTIVELNNIRIHVQAISSIQKFIEAIVVSLDYLPYLATSTFYRICSIILTVRSGQYLYFRYLKNSIFVEIKKTINLQLTRPACQQLPQYVWFPSYCHLLACKPHCIPQEEQVFWEATLGDLADKLRIGVHSRYAL